MYESRISSRPAERKRPCATSDTPQQRVGINTENPVATLDLNKTNVPAGQVEGFMLPHLTQTERNAMTKEALVNGLQIFNIDKNCIDWWNGSTWQCTDGTLQDNHGDTAAHRYTETYTENRMFFKNNCPAGQQAKAGISFNGQGSGVGISAVSLQDAKNKALEAAKLNYYKLGQDNANALGECETSPTAPPTIPIAITDTRLKIGNTTRWFSSIYDNDYTRANGEVIMPTAPASWGDQTPVGDGTAETKVLDVQGIIPKLNAQKDNFIEIAIPIETAPNSTVSLPTFTTYLEIPAEYTEDGKKGVVVFTWEPTVLNSNTEFFKAVIYAKDTDINLKKLDLAKGMGSDHMGLSLGKVRYPIDASDNNPAQWKGELDLRLISGIPDRRFAQETTIDLDTQKRHQFLYAPVLGKNGKIWLNNNLGANYSNIHSNEFNPGQQAKALTDHHSYGSLFQWGRVGDGHEIMDWTGSNTGRPKFISVPGYGMEPLYYGKLNENCPIGWKTPFLEEIIASGPNEHPKVVNLPKWGNNLLKLSLAGRWGMDGYEGSLRYEDFGVSPGQAGSYMTARSAHDNGFGVNYRFGHRYGWAQTIYWRNYHKYSIRCMKE